MGCPSCLRLVRQDHRLHHPSRGRLQRIGVAMTKDKALKVEGPLHVVCQCNWCKAHPEQNLSCKLVQARLAAAWGFVKAQPEPWEKFCDSNCVWTDHHPDCKLAQQEPVAYLCENAVGHKYFRWKKPSSIYKPIALYTRGQA